MLILYLKFILKFFFDKLSCSLLLSPAQEIHSDDEIKQIKTGTFNYD